MRLPILTGMLLSSAFLLQAGTVCGSVAGNLVQNCGFESGLADWIKQPLEDPDANPAAVWLFSGIGVGAASASLPLLSFPFSIPANSGSYAVAFGGTGAITQYITVAEGDTYQVGYYLDASQPSDYDQFCVGIAITTEVSEVGPQNCSALFTGSTIDNDGTIEQGESTGYVKESFQFTATVTPIALTFADYPCIVGLYGGLPSVAGLIPPTVCAGFLTTDTPLYPFLLDDVSVTDITQQGGSSSTPEPGTLITMLGGVAALALTELLKIRRGRGPAGCAGGVSTTATRD
jgi:hypothetical protein